MNADTIARLARTLLQAAGAFIIGKYGIDAVSWESISGAVVLLITTAFTIRAGQKTDGGKVNASPFVTVIGIAIVAAMLAGCSPRSMLDNPNLAAGVNQAVNATDQATQKANAALDKICANYKTVDAAFLLVAALAGDRIPQSVVNSEGDAVRFLDGLCTNRPQDANGALAAAQQAYATILSIRDRFRS